MMSLSPSLSPLLSLWAQEPPLFASQRYLLLLLPLHSLSILSLVPRQKYPLPFVPSG